MKKNKNNLLLVVIIMMISSTCCYFGCINNKTEFETEEKDIISQINGINVTTIVDSDIYKKVGNNYVEIGKIYKNNYVKLVSLNVIDEEYLLVDGFGDNYYIKVDGLVSNESEVIFDNRYKEYLVFNEKIVTDDDVCFFDDVGNEVYKLNFSLNLSIIIKEEEKYGVEYNGRLLYVYKDDVKEVVVDNDIKLNNIDGIRVLNYHFFYEDGNRDGCYEEICASSTQFRSHLEYIKNNDILTLKMKEVEMYIDGKINLPKSVLITIDDGWRTEVAVDLLNEYKMYATIFLVTSWFDVNDYYKNDFVELHSHGDNLHNQGICNGGQGGAIKCLEEDKLIADLSTSSKKLSGSKFFAYPFYEYNDYAIKMLREAGYTMAFAGENIKSDNLIHVSSNKFKLPRFVIVDYTTIEDLKKYFGDSY